MRTGTSVRLGGDCALLVDDEKWAELRHAGLWRFQFLNRYPKDCAGQAIHEDLHEPGRSN